MKNVTVTVSVSRAQYRLDGIKRSPNYDKHLSSNAFVASLIVQEHTGLMGLAMQSSQHTLLSCMKVVCD